MSIHLLWADDDCNLQLAPLGRLLVRRGKFSLVTATAYTEAEERLTQLKRAGNAINALLVDIILPYGGDGGALVTDLGISLADKAAQLGVRSVVFFTVVRMDEVLDKYWALKSQYRAVSWSYFDKVGLLEGKTLDNLIEKLHGTVSGPPQDLEI
jgi:hypothetical protein